jgi:hypothetical protein
MDLQLLMHSVFITNNAVSSNATHEDVLDTTIFDKVCQWLVAGRWFSLETPVSSTNKTDRHDITEILLKVALSNIALTILHTNAVFSLSGEKY